MKCFVIVFHVYEFNGEKYYKDDFEVKSTLMEGVDPYTFADSLFVKEYLHNHLGEYSPENFNPVPYIVPVRDRKLSYMQEIFYPLWYNEIANKNEVFDFMREHSIPFTNDEIQLKGVSPETIVQLVKLLGIEIYSINESELITP